MKLDRRSSFPRRMIGASAKACVAIAALAGAANWAAKGYPDKGPTIAAIAAKASEDPVTTGSIVPRNPAETLKAAPVARAAAPAPEKIVARAPDFDQNALAKLAAATTPAATSATSSRAAATPAATVKAAAPRKRQEAEAKPAR